MVNRNRRRGKVTIVTQVDGASASRRAAPRRRRRTRRGRLNKKLMPINMAGVSPAGKNFLKCAFASPDFAVDPGQGIPDGFEGKALMRKDVYTSTINFTANTDTYFVVMPTPGVAYWTTSVTAGTALQQSTVWTPVYNTSFTTLFGAITNQSIDAPLNPVERALNVSKFRYASSTFEITPTSNYMQYAGAITVWKMPVSLDVMVRTTGVGALQDSTNELALTGLDGLINVCPDNKPFKFIDGAYSMAVNTEPTWDFQAVKSGITRVPGVGETANTNTTFGQFQGDFVGVGDLQTLVFKINTPTGAVNSAIIKAWSCIEYQPTPSSAFYQFASKSPALDMVALKLYRDIANKVPVAVTVAENDGFWSDKVLPIIRSFLGAARIAGKVIPPLGQAVSGVDMITDAFGWM